MDNKGEQWPMVGQEESSFEVLARERELADYAKDQIIYTGLFINPEDVYSKFPAKLSHRIRDPHITTAYRPESEKIILDALGSGADIRAVGYGNDGHNEGLLVEVAADNSAVQRMLVERVAPDDDGELKSVPMHITLSISDDAEAVDTKKLNFQSLAEPVSLYGEYKLFMKDGTLVDSREELQKMKDEGVVIEDEVDPDRL